MLPDVNVLVAAHRADHPHHRTAASWLQDNLSNGAQTGQLVLPMQVAAGFMRLVTDVKVFADVSSPRHALQFLDWLMDNARVTVPTRSAEWSEFRTLNFEKHLQANAIPDAWLASLALSMTEPLVTFDKGFRQLLPRSLLVLLPPSTSVA